MLTPQWGFAGSLRKVPLKIYFEILETGSFGIREH